MTDSPTPQPPCRSNQHCVYFGFCHRCSDDLSQQALSILATLRERLGDEQRVAKAYLAVTSALAEAVLDTPADRGVNHWADKPQAVAPGAQPAALAAGDVIHAFDSEAFGRDRYDCVRVEAAGPDWVVARDPYRPYVAVFASGSDDLARCQQARDAACPLDNPCPLDGTPPLLTTWSPR